MHEILQNTHSGLKISNMSIENWNNTVDIAHIIDLFKNTSFGNSTVSIKNVTIDETNLNPLSVIVPITVVYSIIFLTGVVGNVSTCIVIARNKSMHTATNYYLFSLAMSDMLLLISGLPPEMYRIWSPETYVFGEAFCILQGFAAETSANATVLTITAFTVERYLAICHPFLTHTMSKLSRVVRYIIAIWIIALCLAAPQAMQFGIEYENKNGVEAKRCTVVSTDFFEHAFEISTFLFFVGPMSLITVLYVLIAIRLRKSANTRPSGTNGSANECRESRISRNAAAQNRVIRMLVAVVVAFFICWAPFHAQRLLAVYLSGASQEAQETSVTIYIILMYTSGVLYFLSTTINPVLYHIMSNKFREAFKNTLSEICSKSQQARINRTYSAASSRGLNSVRRLQRSISEAPPISREHSVRNGSKGQNGGSRQIELPNLKHTMPCIIPVSDDRLARRARMMSETSQTTVLTTLSIAVAPPNAIVALAARKRPKGERIVRESQHQAKSSFFPVRFLAIFRKQPRVRNNRRVFRDGSLDSANTISNSSLQDMDEIDFSSSDLVKYMEEINEDIA